MESVAAAAHRFRTAIENILTTLVSFPNFPRGSCGNASEMLAEYLRDSELGEWDYHSGFTEDGRSHGWIEQNGLIVDITADQFDRWGAPPVMVTSDPSWHKRHVPTRMSVHRADLSYCTGISQDDVARAYEAIRAAAEALRDHGSY